MKKSTRVLLTALCLAAVLAANTLFGSFAFVEVGTSISGQGKWATGDFHTHTFLTDGSNTEKEIVKYAFESYGLDWIANSEHGGTSPRDPFGNNFASPVSRWITLSYYSAPIIQALRKVYPQKKLIQGVEWNVPSHDHASVGIVADEPVSISNFEYLFDANDKDTSRANEGLLKQNTTHADAVAGAKWLEDNYKDESYFILNHPSRLLKYSIADIRDFNNAAPNAAFGFEGIPGHQKQSNRGGYSVSDDKARTYGGADYMISKVGGLWDALLGEGRHFWTFANSDFHSTAVCFWPGEYAKSYTLVKGNDYKSLIAGLKSGNSFAVEGDLINGLEFKAKSKNNAAVMGQELIVNKGENAQIIIRFKCPNTNNNGDKVKVNHIDLIAGDVTGQAAPGTPGYSKDTNESTRVIATFTQKDWENEDGWYVIKYDLKNVYKGQYFRLRGTNLGPGVVNETDSEGNPLCDKLIPNNAEQAYKDMWFYSNPVFVSVN